MPMHNWALVEPTLYHHFHQRWSTALADSLNNGLLPVGFSALIEQHAGGLVPDVLTLHRRSASRPSAGTAVLPPKTRLMIEAKDESILRRANRIAVRHRLGEVVAILEIVSPANKASRNAVRRFVQKSHEFLAAGVHVLIIDPFPPGRSDPFSLHKEIWDDYEDVPFRLPDDELLLLASYRAGNPATGLNPTAFLEPFRVGDTLPDMPAWIDDDVHIAVPLERTYMAAWSTCPADFRHLVEFGRFTEE